VIRDLVIGDSQELSHLKNPERHALPSPITNP